MCGDNSEAKGIVLLCDSCDAEYHLTCCTPPLEACPEGEWFCLTCRMNRGDPVSDLFHEVSRVRFLFLRCLSVLHFVRKFKACSTQMTCMIYSHLMI